jgi:hypothetical protein
VKRMTWNQWRVLGLIGGVLILALLAVVVLVNVFAPGTPDAAPEDGSDQGATEGVSENLDQFGMLTPPATQDPTVFGPLAAQALFTYDTRIADYREASGGITAWLQDFDAEPFLGQTVAYADAEETIRFSPFPDQDAYRGQSERETKVTAVVLDVKIDDEHRDWLESWEFNLFHIVTVDLEVTYEFTNDDGTRRELVENTTVSVELRCGEIDSVTRPTPNCVVWRYKEEFWI